MFQLSSEAIEWWKHLMSTSEWRICSTAEGNCSRRDLFDGWNYSVRELSRQCLQYISAFDDSQESIVARAGPQAVPVSPWLTAQRRLPLPQYKAAAGFHSRSDRRCAWTVLEVEFLGFYTKCFLRRLRIVDSVELTESTMNPCVSGTKRNKNWRIFRFWWKFQCVLVVHSIADYVYRTFVVVDKYRFDLVFLCSVKLKLEQKILIIIIVATAVSQIPLTIRLCRWHHKMFA